MAVTYTTYGSWQFGPPAGTGSWTTGSFTPTAGTRLIAIVGVVAVDNADISGDVTIIDSQGLTWTEIGDVGTTDGVDTALVAWISGPVAATSTTLTFDTGARDVFQYCAAVVEVDGADGTIAGYVEDTTPPLNGAGTITLGATPTTDDVVIYARCLGYATDNGWGGIDVASPYVQALVSPGSLIGITIVASDNASSTTITINDASPGYDPSTRMVDHAFIVRAAGGGGGGTVYIPDEDARPRTAARRSSRLIHEHPLAALAVQPVAPALDPERSRGARRRPLLASPDPLGPSVPTGLEPFRTAPRALARPDFPRLSIERPLAGLVLPPVIPQPPEPLTLRRQPTRPEEREVPRGLPIGQLPAENTKVALSRPVRRVPREDAPTRSVLGDWSADVERPRRAPQRETLPTADAPPAALQLALAALIDEAAPLARGRDQRSPKASEGHPFAAFPLGVLLDDARRGPQYPLRVTLPANETPLVGSQAPVLGVVLEDQRGPRRVPPLRFLGLNETPAAAIAAPPLGWFGDEAPFVARARERVLPETPAALPAFVAPLGQLLHEQIVGAARGNSRRLPAELEPLTGLIRPWLSEPDAPLRDRRTQSRAAEDPAPLAAQALQTLLVEAPWAFVSVRRRSLAAGLERPLAALALFAAGAWFEESIPLTRRPSVWRGREEAWIVTTPLLVILPAPTSSTITIPLQLSSAITFPVQLTSTIKVT